MKIGFSLPRQESLPSIRKSSGAQQVRGATAGRSTPSTRRSVHRRDCHPSLGHGLSKGLLAKQRRFGAAAQEEDRERRREEALEKAAETTLQALESAALSLSLHTNILDDAGGGGRGQTRKLSPISASLQAAQPFGD